MLPSHSYSGGMPRVATVPALLDELLHTDGARPLITFYDLGTGERVELSVATTDNWVAKTANLLQDSLGVQAGARITVDLPLHWQTVVWALACWRAGCVLVVEGDGRTDVAVLRHPAAGGPQAPEKPAADADDVVALALLPMGVPSPASLPPGVLDYDAEVLGHGDRFTANSPVTPDTPAVEVQGATTTHADLLAAVGTAAEPATPRLLLTDPPTGVDALPAWLAAIASGGSLVLVTGADRPEHADALGDLVSSEQVTARA
jgi:uncharacterized protein (TIGR03089 family)